MKDFKVVVTEYERGWGQSIDEVREFETLADADAFALSINSRNTASRAPDCYLKAEVRINR